MSVYIKPLSCAALILGICACAPEESGSERKGLPRSAAPLAVSGVVAIETSSDVLLTATGNVLAGEEVSLSSEVAGRIVKIGFTEGSHVQKGSLLIKLNDDELRASLERTGHEKDLIKEQLKRQEHLLEIKGVSQEEFDIVRNALLVKESEIAMLQAQIDKTEIRAPFSGSIGLKYVSEGAYITPTTVIASLQSIKPAKIDFSIPEQYSPLIQRGQKVSFTVAAYPQELEATIYAIEPRIDQINRTLKIRATYPNDDERLRPGSFANVQVSLPGAEQVIEIPAKALMPALKGANVLVCKGGKVEERNITLGQRFENSIQIAEGLSTGDTVITSGLLQLKPGMPVQVDVIGFEPSSKSIKPAI
jgi:membrane fusion protein (multidrug efflux system)